MMTKKAHDTFVRTWLEAHDLQLQRLRGVNYVFDNGVACNLDDRNRGWLLAFSEEAARVVEGTLAVSTLRKYTCEQLKELGQLMNNCDKSYENWERVWHEGVEEQHRWLLAETATRGWGYYGIRNEATARLFFALYPEGKPGVARAKNAPGSVIFDALKVAPRLVALLERNLEQGLPELLEQGRFPDLETLRTRFAAAVQHLDSLSYGMLFQLFAR